MSWRVLAKRVFRCLGLFWLLGNVCLVSIPRCDALFANLKHSGIAQLSPSCHNSSESGSGHSPRLMADDLCRCQILQAHFALSEGFIPERHIKFLVQSSHLIEFAIAPWHSRPKQDLESPPPRFA